MNAVRLCLYFVIVQRIFNPRFSDNLYLCFQLTAIIVLEHLRVGERTNLVKVRNHIGYVFHLFPSHVYLYLFLYNISLGMYNKPNWCPSLRIVTW